MNPFDLQRRLSVIFDDLLPESLENARMLDLGCGTGWFSKGACERRARVVSLDISPALARIARRRAQTLAISADACRAPFAAGSFDLIISSEMLEHLPEPERGIQEIARLLAPGGIAILTTPNRHWLWLVNAATQLRLRPYEGYENFLGFRELRSLFAKHGLNVEIHCGFHPWPFQITFLRPLSQYVDRKYGRGPWGAWMINQAVRVTRPK